MAFSLLKSGTLCFEARCDIDQLVFKKNIHLNIGRLVYLHFTVKKKRQLFETCTMSSFSTDEHHSHWATMVGVVPFHLHSLSVISVTCYELPTADFGGDAVCCHPVSCRNFCAQWLKKSRTQAFCMASKCSIYHRATPVLETFGGKETLY